MEFEIVKKSRTKMGKGSWKPNLGPLDITLQFFNCCLISGENDCIVRVENHGKEKTWDSVFLSLFADFGCNVVMDASHYEYK